jgi:LuxR family maltose regulon positive regulatory protein
LRPAKRQAAAPQDFVTIICLARSEAPSIGSGWIWNGMMASWLLRAKILPPKQLVVMHRRAALLKLLAAAPARKLTFLEAPAGFGKTTLLAQWREHLLDEGVCVGWLALDGDDLGDRFATYLAFALQEAGVAMDATHLLAGDRGGAPTGVLALHAILDCVGRSGKPVCMIFDDAERLTASGAQQQLDVIIRYAPENLHVAVAARRNPGFSLADLALNGLVTHIDASHLRFTPGETGEYLKNTASAHELRILTEKTEGWPAALQILLALVAQAGDDGAAILANSCVSELATAYFTQQLVKGLTRDQHDFLCDVSVLEEISIPLADHVRAARDSARLLHELDYLSALIPPLEGGYGLFRLHPMLREYFSARGTLDPLRAGSVHRRAAQWFASRGKLPAALHHAAAAGDRTLAAELIVSAGAVSIWIRHGMAEVLAADHLIDEEMIKAYPRLGLLRCIVFIKQSRLREARALYERVSDATGDFGHDPAGADIATLRRESLFVLSMLALYGCLPFSGAHLEALDKGMHDPEADDVELAHHKTVLCVTYLQNARFDLSWRFGEEAASHCRSVGSIYGANFIDFHIGSIAMARGDTQEAVQRYEKGRRTSRRHFPHDEGLRLIGDVLTAELDLERNAISNVKRRLARIIDRLHDAEAWFDIYAAAYGAASEIYFAERGLDETLAFVDQAQSRAEHLGLVKLGPMLDALRVTALTRAGEIARAEYVVERSAVDFAGLGLGAGESAAWREVEAIATAQVLLLLRLGRCGEALRAADLALGYTRARGLARMALRMNVLAAQAADVLGDRARAAAIVGEICGEAHRTGYVRAVLRDGAGLLPLLDDAGRNLPGESLRQTARDLKELLTGHASAASRAPVFSARELDVLQQLNQGLQDKVIARRLGVTEHAVRFHLKNIYAKTRARGRLEAVVRARELGVLGRQTY